MKFDFLHKQDRESAYEVVKAVDKARRYIFGEGDDATMTMMSSAMGAEFDFFKYPSLCNAKSKLLLYYFFLRFSLTDCTELLQSKNAISIPIISENNAISFLYFTSYY